MTHQPAARSEVRRDLAWILLAAAVLFLPFLGARDLWNPNEPVYGRAVVEMAQDGSWLVPTVNGQTFDEKPILYFWMARLSSAALGQVDEFTLRLPNALIAVASVGLVYLLVCPYTSRRRARLAAAIFATTFMVFWTARAVQMDSLILASTLAALLAVTRVVDHGGKPRRGWALAGLATGLGFLAKGPVGLICPALVVAVYILSDGRWRQLRPGPLLWAGSVCLLVAAPWFAALALSGRSDFLHEVLVRQNLTRFVEPWDHKAPWYYYLRYFWIDMAPWSFLVPLALAAAPADPDERRLDRLAWIWIGTIVLFFSLSSSKRSAYVLPVAPAVAILVSGVAERWLYRSLGRFRAAWIYVWLSVIALGSLGLAAYVRLRVLPDKPLVETPGRATAILLLAGGAAILGALASGRHRKALASSAVLAFLATLYLHGAAVLLPAIDIYKSSRPFCRRVLARVDPADPLRAYRPWKWRASYSFYTGRSIEPLDSAAELRRYWLGRGPAHLIVEERRLEEARSVIGPVRPVVERRVGSRRVYLFSRTPETSADVGAPQQQQRD